MNFGKLIFNARPILIQRTLGYVDVCCDRLHVYEFMRINNNEYIFIFLMMKASNTLLLNSL